MPVFRRLLPYVLAVAMAGTAYAQTRPNEAKKAVVLMAAASSKDGKSSCMWAKEDDTIYCTKEKDSTLNLYIDSEADKTLNYTSSRNRRNGRIVSAYLIKVPGDTEDGIRLMERFFSASIPQFRGKIRIIDTGTDVQKKLQKEYEDVVEKTGFKMPTAKKQ